MCKWIVCVKNLCNSFEQWTLEIELSVLLWFVGRWCFDPKFLVKDKSLWLDLVIFERVVLWLSYFLLYSATEFYLFIMETQQGLGIRSGRLRPRKFFCVDFWFLQFLLNVLLLVFKSLINFECFSTFSMVSKLGFVNCNTGSSSKPWIWNQLQNYVNLIEGTRVLWTHLVRPFLYLIVW